MNRWLGLMLLVAAMAAGAVAAGSKPSSALAAGYTPPQQESVAPTYPGADYVYLMSQECLQGNRVRINISWNTYQLGLQWVDLSLFNNGFVFGTFIGMGPLAPQQSSATWDGLLPGYTHYLRVNTLSYFGWSPSQTFSFFTRTDCGTTVYDSDGDGVPDYLDRCPFQPGPQAYGGCPIYNPPPYPGPQPMTCPVTTTVIGNYSGCVWTNKADYAVFSVGETITYCYAVNQPMQVRLSVLKPDGSTVVVVQGYDDGRGDCLSGLTGLPTGLRTVTLYGGPSLAVLGQWHFYVQ